MNPLFVGLGVVVLLCAPAACLVESPDLRHDVAGTAAAGVAERTVSTLSPESRTSVAERLVLARLEKEVLEPLRRSSPRIEQFSRVRLPVRPAYRSELVRPVDPRSGVIAFRILESNARLARPGATDDHLCVLQGEVRLADGRVTLRAGDHLGADRERALEPLRQLLQPVDAAQARTSAK